MIKFASLKGNRPKAACVFSLALAACLLLFLPGCQGPLGMQDTARTGTLSVTVEGPPGQARTALPDGRLVYNFDRLVFTFAPGAGQTATFDPVTRDIGLGDDPINIDNIPTGPWILTVTAYLYDEYADPDDRWDLTAQGQSESFTIAANLSTPVSVTLDPEEYGYGVFEWTVTFPAIVTSIAVVVIEDDDYRDTLYYWFLAYGDDCWDANDYYVTATGSGTVPAGTHLALFNLVSDDGSALPLGTILRVYRNMISVFDMDIPFAPATPGELAIFAIETHPAWTAVNQPWRATAVADALANVQAQVDAVIAGLGVTAVVSWDAAAPTPGEAGAAAADIDFTVTVETYSIGITVSVAFLPSHAQAALAAITDALGTIQAPFTAGWADSSDDTLAYALGIVQARVSAAITNATAVVSWVSAPTLDGSEVPQASYEFSVAITGNDTTTGSIVVTVPITFAADGDVTTDALVAAIAEAGAMFIGVVIAPNGNAININVYWVTQEAYDALRAAIAIAQGFLVGAGQVAVNAAVDALGAAMALFVPAPGLYDPAITDALGALDAAIAAAQAVARANYTPASLAVMDDALEDAVAAQGDRTLTVTQIDAIRDALLDAIEDLVTLVDEARDALRPVIALAVLRTPDDYGPAVRLIFTQALSAAQAAYAYGGATAGELNTARTNLENAMDNLVSLVSARAALQGIIDTANARVQANYTPASWAPFAAARAAAVIAVGTAETVEELEAARMALYDAMGNLVSQESGNFTVTWPGFTNQMASVGVNVDMNGAGGTLTVIGYEAAGLTNIRWYEGLNRLGTGPTLTRNNMPPVVTVWAEVGGRTYSLVVDVNNPPTGAGN